MPKLNRKFMLYNIRDAREQLEEIEKLLQEKDLSEADLQAKIEHAFHHLNFAWNIKFLTDKRIKEMSDSDFNEWSRYPPDIENYEVSIS